MLQRQVLNLYGINTLVCYGLLIPFVNPALNALIAFFGGIFITNYMIKKLW